MSKKNKKRIPKNDKFVVMDSIEATRVKKPQYNGYSCGYGPHGKHGYDRNAEKRRFAKEVGKTDLFRFCIP